MIRVPDPLDLYQITPGLGAALVDGVLEKGRDEPLLHACQLRLGIPPINVLPPPIFPSLTSPPSLLPIGLERTKVSLNLSHIPFHLNSDLVFVLHHPPAYLAYNHISSNNQASTFEITLFAPPVLSLRHPL